MTQELSETLDICNSVDAVYLPTDVGNKTEMESGYSIFTLLALVWWGFD